VKILESQPVIFTDLDGTLLDRETYSCEKAIPAIRFLQEERIPIVFCSAKTCSEQEVYRQQLNIADPFIVENGGAIFIPADYFKYEFNFTRQVSGYNVVELGISYSKIREILQNLRELNDINYTGYGDMSDEEVAAETGLSKAAAHLARQREYEETLVLRGTFEETNRVLASIKQAGLNYMSGGRYYGVMGDNDKGQAVKILTELFRKKFGRIKTIAIGDSRNDVSMLACVDLPVLVQKPDGSWENIDMPDLYRVNAIGPEGWSVAIDELIRKVN